MDWKDVNAGAPVITRTERRAVLTKIAEDNAANPDAIITRGFLRLEQVANGRNRYQFPVIGENGEVGVRASERRLRRTDAFYCDEISLWLGRRTLTSPAGSWEPHVFANTIVFPGAVEGPALRTLMNSAKLSVTVGQTIWLAAWDTVSGRYVGMAQQGLLNGVAGAPFLADSWDRDKVFNEQTPTFRLNGGSTNDIQLWVDETIDATSQVVTDENVLALVLHGWYAANCGQFNTL